MPRPYGEPVEISDRSPRNPRSSAADAKIVVGATAPASSSTDPDRAATWFRVRIRERRHPHTGEVHWRLERRRAGQRGEAEDRPTDVEPHLRRARSRRHARRRLDKRRAPPPHPRRTTAAPPPSPTAPHLRRPPHLAPRRTLDTRTPPRRPLPHAPPPDRQDPRPRTTPTRPQQTTTRIGPAALRHLRAPEMGSDDHVGEGFHHPHLRVRQAGSPIARGGDSDRPPVVPVTVVGVRVCIAVRYCGAPERQSRGTGEGVAILREGAVLGAHENLCDFTGGTAQEVRVPQHHPRFSIGIGGLAELDVPSLSRSTCSAGRSQYRVSPRPWFLDRRVLGEPSASSRSPSLAPSTAGPSAWPGRTVRLTIPTECRFPAGHPAAPLDHVVRNLFAQAGSDRGIPFVVGVRTHSCECVTPRTWRTNEVPDARSASTARTTRPATSAGRPVPRRRRSTWTRGSRRWTAAACA